MGKLIITKHLTDAERRVLNTTLRTKYGGISRDEAQRIAWYTGVRWTAVNLWFNPNVTRGGVMLTRFNGECYIAYAGGAGNDPDMQERYRQKDTGRVNGEGKPILGRVPGTTDLARWNVASVLGDGLARHKLCTGKRSVVRRPCFTLLEGLQLADRYYSGYEDDAYGFRISHAFTLLKVGFDENDEFPYMFTCEYNRPRKGDSLKADADCSDSGASPFEGDLDDE